MATPTAAIYSTTHTHKPSISFPRRTRYGTVIVALAALAAPARAVEYFDYGFAQVDNSSGGGVLDGYVSQQFWADTELLLLGAQLRIELESGSLFQDTIAGSEFSFGAPHAVLAAEQPSLAFDTYVGINGAQPGLISGGAVNLGGQPGLLFDDNQINAAWSSGPGNLESGQFDLGMITLTSDAIGRGAILLSGSDDGRRDRRSEMFAHEFVIESGVVRFLGEPVLHAASYLPHRERQLSPDPEPPSDPLPPLEPPPLPEIPTGLPVPDAPPVVIEFDPEPIIEPDAEPPASDPYEPDEPIGQSAGLPNVLIYHPGIELAPRIIDPNVANPINLPYTDVLQLPLDAQLLLDRVAASDTLEGMALDANDLTVLRAVDGTHAAAITATVGELAVPLGTLTDDAVSDLLSTGNWSIRGANLVFGVGAGGGVPEPSSVALAMLFAGMLGWRWRYCLTANPRR